MCVVCDEFGEMGCPACEEMTEPEMIVCPCCGGDGKFYYLIPEEICIEEKVYKKMDILQKINIEVEDCLECDGTGYVELKLNN